MHWWVLDLSFDSLLSDIFSPILYLFQMEEVGASVCYLLQSISFEDSLVASHVSFGVSHILLYLYVDEYYEAATNCNVCTS